MNPDLSKRDAMIWLLYTGSEITYAALARIYGCSTGAVRRAVWRADRRINAAARQEARHPTTLQTARLARAGAIAQGWMREWLADEPPSRPLRK